MPLSDCNVVYDINVSEDNIIVKDSWNAVVYDTEGNYKFTLDGCFVKEDEDSDYVHQAFCTLAFDVGNCFLGVDHSNGFMVYDSSGEYSGYVWFSDFINESSIAFLNGKVAPDGNFYFLIGNNGKVDVYKMSGF